LFCYIVYYEKRHTNPRGQDQPEQARQAGGRRSDHLRRCLWAATGGHRAASPEETDKYRRLRTQIYTRRLRLRRPGRPRSGDCQDV